MKNWAIALLVILLVASCKTTHEQYDFGPLGEYYWNNTALSNLSVNIFQQEFTKIKAQCEVEVSKVPIPLPKCVLPAKNQCALLTSSGLGMCYSAPKRKCDYRAINVAKQERENIFSNCMKTNGWVLEWKPGESENSSGGFFEYVASDNENEYFIKLNSFSHVGSKYTVIVRIIPKENTKKSSQGIYIFDVSSSTLKIDNDEPILYTHGSAADALLTIIKQLE